MRWELLVVVAFGCGGGGAKPDAARPIDAADAMDAPADVAPDAPPLVVDEPPNCGGDPLLAHQGDAALAISALTIPPITSSYDLDGDGRPDNKLAALSSLAQSSIDDGLMQGTFVVPIELFDRDADPDPCLKLGMYRGSCAMAGCDLTDATVDVVDLDPTSIDPSGAPYSRLRAMMTAAGGTVHSGPGYLEMALPVTNEIVLDLPITVIVADGTLTGSGGATALSMFRVGGVLQAFRLDQLAAPDIAQVGTMPGDTLLDVIYANLFGPLLALPRYQPLAGCRTADIDVDGDGLEAFCDSNPNDDVKRVDTCIDGDGTVIHDGDGGIAQCTQATVDGKPRFVDGISVEIDLSANPATIAP
jgi:hypothetical protein